MATKVTIKSEPKKVDKVKVIKVSEYLSDPEIMNAIVIDKYVHSLKKIYNENKVIAGYSVREDILLVCEV